MVLESFEYVIQVPILLYLYTTNNEIAFVQNPQAKITKTKLILTTNSIMFPFIGIGTCEYI